jgi:hypothetical protein
VRVEVAPVTAVRGQVGFLDELERKIALPLR